MASMRRSRSAGWAALAIAARAAPIQEIIGSSIRAGRPTARAISSTVSSKGAMAPFS
jgi:hypothetical protein